jgi:hypothetical protein
LEFGLALVALLVAAYSLVAARLERLSISSAFAFVVIGILVSEDFLGILALEPEAESVKLIAEITLALVLFGDASTVSDPAEANVSSRISQTPARSFPQFCCRHQSSESNRWGAGDGPPKPDRTCPGVAVSTPTTTNTQDTSDFIVISLSRGL